MSKVRSLFFTILCLLLFATGGSAQILDDEETLPNNEIVTPSEQAEDDNEELFNEYFSDYSETERDITKVKTFGDAIDQIADLIPKEAITAEKKEESTEEDKPLPPIEGDLTIGITNGSFRISKNSLGQPACRFTVTMLSTLNRKIKTLSFNLVYPHRVFAFIFRDVAPEGYQIHPISTTGDICYNLMGAPDIDIHTCKIYGASGEECAARLKWDEKIKAPEGAKDPFQYFN